jgi:hypothetical protein
MFTARDGMYIRFVYEIEVIELFIVDILCELNEFEVIDFGNQVVE